MPAAKAHRYLVSFVRTGLVTQDRHSGRYDLVILDLGLPEVDGLEVCKILRRDPGTASIPILMLTARAAEMDRVLGLELGPTTMSPSPSARGNWSCGSRSCSRAPRRRTIR